MLTCLNELPIVGAWMSAVCSMHACCCLRGEALVKITAGTYLKVGSRHFFPLLFSVLRQGLSSLLPYWHYLCIVRLSGKILQQTPETVPLLKLLLRARINKVLKCSRLLYPSTDGPWLKILGDDSNSGLRTS